MTLLAIALALAIGYIAGRFHQHHRASLLAENIHWVGEYNEAIKGADLDADVAAHRRERLSGEQPAVSDEHVDQPRPTPVPLGERECNNCHKPAAFAWKTDGFPFAACNLCVSLWFEDGLPDHVVRLEPNGRPVVPLPLDDEHDDQCESEFINPPGAYGPCGCSDRTNGVLGPTLIPVEGLNAWELAIHADDLWVHTPCGTELTRDDDGTEWCSTCGTTVDQCHDALTTADDTSSTGPRSVPGPRVSD